MCTCRNVQHDKRSNSTYASRLSFRQCKLYMWPWARSRLLGLLCNKIRSHWLLKECCSWSWFERYQSQYCTYHDFFCIRHAWYTILSVYNTLSFSSLLLPHSFFLNAGLLTIIDRTRLHRHTDKRKCRRRTRQHRSKCSKNCLEKAG